MDAALKAFLCVLDPCDTSTGGGTASAVAGAMAAALVAMVARLSLGKTKVEPAPFYQSIADEAEALSRNLSQGAGDDSESFEAVRATLRMPKQSEEERTLRQTAFAAAMLHATEVPLSNAQLCRRVLELIRMLKGRSNPNAASDLECAFLLAQAGLKGCLANVAVNLPSIKQAHHVDRLKSKAEELERLG
ncbi:MAG: cyclodeaminase/cyclohydrolase family protein [Desulfobacterales bacterium]